MPKTTLAIEAFIRARLTELGLSDDEFRYWLGYRKMRKAKEHLKHLYLGCFDHRHMVRLLPTALELPQSVVRGVLEETGRQLRAIEEAAYSADFEPHAVILPERLIPSPIFVVAFIGVSRLLRIDFDLTEPPDTFAAQALDGLTKRLLEYDSRMSESGFTADLIERRGVIELLGEAFGERFAPEVIRRRATLPSFGAATGFVVNFAPDHAIRYDFDGHAVETLGRAKRLGSTSFALSGRPLSGAELNSLFGKSEVVRLD